MQRPGNTQNQPQASKPRPGPAVRPDPDRRGMRGARPWWRHGLFVCNLAILHTSSPLPPRTRTLGHLASPTGLQSTTYTSYVLPIAIALSHENEYHIFLRILLKVLQYVKPWHPTIGSHIIYLKNYFSLQILVSAHSSGCNSLNVDLLWSLHLISGNIKQQHR